MAMPLPQQMEHQYIGYIGMEGNITGLKGDDLYKYFGDIQNPKTKEKTNDAVLILVSPSFNENRAVLFVLI